MNIRVNDESKTVPDASTLAGALTVLGLAERKGIAVALNGEVVPRLKWSQKTLAESDTLLLIRATQGG